MEGKLQRFFRRPFADQRLAVAALFLCLLTAVALRTFGFRRWVRILEGFPAGRRCPGASSENDLRVAETHASIVNMVVANIPGQAVDCLPRSLTLWWLLRRVGVATDLRIGVRKSDPGIKAHAWVVCQGVALGERGHGAYTPFDESVLAA
ncbi:MAG: lasso peptide biosynthesis B2 protein [Hyphomicrobiales bacterium]|nr:lasso peptide biosynthesis B2 protein [Hyphomicrobiales bacterium]